MGFKENILEKIRIDTLAGRVCASIDPTDPARRADLDAMRRLLEAGPFDHQRIRDLDIYSRKVSRTGETARPMIVLDNALAAYNTTAADIAVRKSPTIKEMISIRNAMRILNDGKIVHSRGKETVRGVQQEAIAALDLAFDREDIDTLEKEGRAYLADNHRKDCETLLSIFFELLDWKPLPAGLQPVGATATGFKSDGSRPQFGPVVVHGRTAPGLRYVNERFSPDAKSDHKRLTDIADGAIAAESDQGEVFTRLKQQVDARYFSGPSPWVYPAAS
ncbi:MAG: hypothetical protein CSA22_05365 [Deltaproteobacteria bacterium]|nr:MAG: hypothetical protein CSA22_05365 [Deltaproteobacteria bacterium]